MPYQKIVPSLNAAGIRVYREGEAILGITRQTIYKWDTGVDPKMKRVRQQVDYTMNRVRKAVEMKLLPLDVGVKDPVERLAKIKAALTTANAEMARGL
jgi:hypothetical protein